MTGRVIIKGTEEIGSVAGKTGLVIVKCVELRDVATNQREFGLIITVRESDQIEDSSMVDSDELDSLLRGVDYISKADPTITSLNDFQAAHATRGGLRVVSYSSRRTSTTEAALISNRYVRSKSLINLPELIQFKVLLEQAQTKLEAVRKSK